MLSLTDEVRDAIDVFDECFRPQADGWGHTQMVRVALPRGGGVDDQDPRMMAMLSQIEHAVADLMAEHARERATAARARKEDQQRRGRQ